MSKAARDLPTRIAHWLLAIAVALNLFLLEDDPHNWVGYFAVAVVAFRLVWAVRRRELSAQNPLALIIYISIWALVFALAATGWMMGLDRYWGEEWLEEIHEALSDSLLVLICIHLAGVFMDSILKRRKTWMRMITGA